MTKQDYVKNYWNSAVSACEGTKIFPILALAESAVESSWGESGLTKNANNLFGVKALGDSWKGAICNMRTLEYDKEGEPYYINAPFRSYKSPIDSFKDYVSVVGEEERYINTGTESAKTPEEQIIDIAEGGYSTSASYSTLITTIISELRPIIWQIWHVAV